MATRPRTAGSSWPVRSLRHFRRWPARPRRLRLGVDGSHEDLDYELSGLRCPVRDAARQLATVLLIGGTPVRSVGIDPAPAKGLHIFDAYGARTVAVPNAGLEVKGLARRENVLICWDAPLTGPPSDVLDGKPATGSAYTMRAIEKFFSRAETGFRAPKGISVRGYGGCPHWTISRALLGLPRVGPFDLPEDQLPFRMAWTPPGTGRWIVEVHPALAIWLWAPKYRGAAELRYKDDPKILKGLWSTIERGPWAKADLPSVRPPENDDQLDARVAYLLGHMWLNNGSVTLLGDSSSGALLLPKVEGLQQAWEQARSDLQ